MEELLWILAWGLAFPTFGVVVKLSGELVDKIKSNILSNIAIVFHALASVLSILLWPAIVIIIFY